MMPPKAAAACANQSSALAGAIHEKKTAPALSALLCELDHRTTTDLSTDLNPYELANIRLALKQWKEVTVLTSEVKSTSNWPAVIAALKIQGGICEEARLINEKARASLNLQLGDDCFKGYYQVLLDTYEPGFKDDRLQALFQDLKTEPGPIDRQDPGHELSA
ncbi:hypothetical protein CPB97_000964 [Podila verticillata]|nr:hypothetical protein CPB97_000964 [Podila verticillata]